ncbi:MAG: hypothetical protein M1374_01790 [Firmicutes bacterium]|nr:hypothetical protein [Bacillota bacterium]
MVEIPPDDKNAWRVWFRPELTGWSATDAVADDTQLVTTITQTQLTAPFTGHPTPSGRHIKL